MQTAQLSQPGPDGVDAALRALLATLLTGLEERLHILIEDDDVEAEDFMTFGRLLAFAERKVMSS